MNELRGLYAALQEIARLTDAEYPGNDPQRRLVNTIAHDALDASALAAPRAPEGPPDAIGALTEAQLAEIHQAGIDPTDSVCIDTEGVRAALRNLLGGVSCAPEGPRGTEIATQALAAATLTVEWLRKLLATADAALAPTERLAFAKLLYEKGVLDEAGLMYVQRGVTAQQNAQDALRGVSCALPEPTQDAINAAYQRLVGPVEAAGATWNGQPTFNERITQALRAAYAVQFGRGGMGGGSREGGHP